MSTLIPINGREVEIKVESISTNTSIVGIKIPLLPNYFFRQNTEENRMKPHFYSKGNLYSLGDFLSSFNGNKISMDVYKNFIIIEKDKKLFAICNNGFIVPDNSKLRWKREALTILSDVKINIVIESDDGMSSEIEGACARKNLGKNMRNRRDYSDDESTPPRKRDYDTEEDEDFKRKEFKKVKTVKKIQPQIIQNTSVILLRHNNGEFYEYYHLNSGTNSTIKIVGEIEGFYEIDQIECLPRYLDYFAYIKSKDGACWYVDSVNSSPRCLEIISFDDLNIPMYYNPILNGLF